jgi:HTH-type transcriptional regulator/antitoxin HipB
MAKVSLRTPADIGALIRDRRRALDLGQAELAAKIGVSRLWINQIERGKPGASLGLVLRTLAALNVALRSEFVDQATAQVRGKRRTPVPRVDIDAVVARARGKFTK